MHIYYSNFYACIGILNASLPLKALHLLYPYALRQHCSQLQTKNAFPAPVTTYLW